MLTELGGSQVEVQQCSLGSEGPRLRSSGAQCAQTLAVEVQQWPLRAEVGEELGEELARRKWTWKWRQRWWRRTRRRRRRRRRTTLIKSNNPHLAGGELNIFSVSYTYTGLHSVYTKPLKEQNCSKDLYLSRFITAFFSNNCETYGSTLPEFARNFPCQFECEWCTKRGGTLLCYLRSENGSHPKQIPRKNNLCEETDLAAMKFPGHRSASPEQGTAAPQHSAIALKKA